jgi:hypothetical protein
MIAAGRTDKLPGPISAKIGRKLLAPLTVLWAFRHTDDSFLRAPVGEPCRGVWRIFRSLPIVPKSENFPRRKIAI